MPVKNFINSLINAKPGENVYNPYTDPVKANNLFLYLTFMLQHNPVHLFVGEAPGYRGCALSGIPFTAEYQLIPPGNNGLLPFQQNGYAIVSSGRSHREGSATTIWNAIGSRNSAPLLWNIFPFHPHKLDNTLSNRTPSQTEVNTFSYLVNELITLFPSIEQVHAIGKTAQRQLNAMGIQSSYIRHPANGGATECRNSIVTIHP